MSRPAGGTERRDNRRLRPLLLYLGASLGLATLGSLTSLRYINIGHLWLLVCQPFVLYQIAHGPLGMKGAPPAATNILLVASHIVYFAAILYPAYRIATIDRSRDRPHMRPMTILLVLLCSLHVLVALFLIVAHKA